MGDQSQSFTKMAGAKAAGEAPVVGVGMLGYAFMGKAHSNAYKKLPYMMYPPVAMPRLVADCGPQRRSHRRSGRRYGYERYYTDWHKLIEDPEVHLFDNGGPGDMHAEPTIAAAQAGKHVFCEKPLSRNAEEGYEMWQEVAEDGREAHGGAQLPLCAGHPPGLRPDQQRQTGPHLPLPRRLPAGMDHAPLRHGADLAPEQESGRQRRARRPWLPCHRPGPLPVRRGQEPAGDDQDLHPDPPTPRRHALGSGRRRRVRLHLRVRKRRHRHDRSEPVCRGPQELQLLGDQRREGVHPLRPGAHERAGGLLGGRRTEGNPGLAQGAGDRRLPSVHRQLVAARAHHRVGALVRARNQPPARLHRQR